MQFQIIILFAIVICTCIHAQVSQPPYYKLKYPDTYKYAKIAKHPRDVNRNEENVYRQRIRELKNVAYSSFDKGGFKPDVSNAESSLKVEADDTHVSVQNAKSRERDTKLP